MWTVYLVFGSVIIIFLLLLFISLFHHIHVDMCTRIICVCINILEDKRSISLPVDQSAASSNHQTLSSISLCVVTTSMCLYVVCFPTAAMLNSGTTSGLGHTDSPAHIKQQRGSFPGLEKTKIFVLYDPPRPVMCSKRNINIWITKTEIWFPEILNVCIKKQSILIRFC